MIQDTVLLITVVLMGVVTASFLWVGFGASEKAADYKAVQKKSYGVRGVFFSALLVSGIVITLITTSDLPYAANRGNIPDDALQVNIEGRQWAWVMDKSEASAGQTVVFNVTASDVTHGLGVYNPDMRMIAQTQAMPFGYVNRLKVTFDEPGEYKLLCMEYCGLAHHNMISSFTINP